jgi:hypothetical protein
MSCGWLTDKARGYQMDIGDSTVYRHITEIILHLGVSSRFAGGAAAQPRGRGGKGQPLAEYPQFLPAQRLTRSVSLSADATQVAFTADGGGDEADQAYLVSVEGVEPVMLSPDDGRHTLAEKIPFSRQRRSLRHA